jgi:hypothetical protein
MPLYAKSWRDQPEEVTVGVPILKVKVAGYAIEVRHIVQAGTCTVTVGNALGSTTVLCDDAIRALMFIDEIAKGASLEIPRGCRILPNAVREETP